MCDYSAFETEDSFRIKRELNGGCESFLVDDFYPVFKFKQVEGSQEEPEFENEDEDESRTDEF